MLLVLVCKQGKIVIIFLNFGACQYAHKSEH